MVATLFRAVSPRFFGKSLARCRREVQLARGESDFWKRFRPARQTDDRKCYAASPDSDADLEEGGDCSSMSAGDSKEHGDGDGGTSSTADSEEDRGATTGHLVARLNHFIFRDKMLDVRAAKRPRHDRGTDVWELVNEPVEVGVAALKGPCVVTVSGASGGAGVDAATDDVPHFTAAGFATKTPRTRTVRVVKTPWRRSGIDGLFLDRRAASVHENVHRYPVFSTGIVIASDAFTYFSLGGSNYSVNSSYFALGCLNPSLLRRLRAWFMCTAGAPRARWEEEVGPLMKTIKLLQSGCRARVSTGDGNTITVSHCGRVRDRGNGYHGFGFCVLSRGMFGSSCTTARWRLWLYILSRKIADNGVVRSPTCQAPFRLLIKHLVRKIARRAAIAPVL